MENKESKGEEEAVKEMERSSRQQAEEEGKESSKGKSREGKFMIMNTAEAAIVSSRRISIANKVYFCYCWWKAIYIEVKNIIQNEKRKENIQSFIKSSLIF